MGTSVCPCGTLTASSTWVPPVNSISYFCSPRVKKRMAPSAARPPLTTTAGRTNRIQSSDGAANNWNMFNCLTMPHFMAVSKIIRVTTTAVNMLTRMPMIMTTANPLTSSVARPGHRSTNAGISVVRLASRMVRNARWYARFRAKPRLPPLPFSSRRRS